MEELFDILVQDHDGTRASAAVSAIGWLDTETLRGLVQPLLDNREARVRAMGLGACTVHRVDPGDQLQRHLKDVPIVRKAALKLACLLGRADIRISTSEEYDDACAFYTAWANVRKGDKGAALSTLWNIASVEGVYQLPAFECAVLASQADEVGSMLSGFASAADKFKVRAAGLVGQVDMVDWLIEQMHDPLLAQLAGESFAMITGADLAFLDLDTASKANGPNDDPNDPHTDLDLDDDLATPCPKAVAQWWTNSAHNFSESSGYALGKPKCLQTYWSAFMSGFQRQKRIAAIAHGYYLPTHPLLNWKAREKPQNNTGHAPGYWDKAVSAF